MVRKRHLARGVDSEADASWRWRITGCGLCQHGERGWEARRGAAAELSSPSTGTYLGSGDPDLGFHMAGGRAARVTGLCFGGSSMWIALESPG